MTEEKKPDCVLSDGREIFIDLTKVTIQEWRDMFKPEQAEEAGDAVVAKVSGMTMDTLHELNVQDWKLLSKIMFEAFRKPLANPTLPSV
jgi:hypothetical protein